MVSVILLMAGKGQRMNLDKNKVLLNLNNKPIYQYSLELFKSYNFEIICVISKDDESEILNSIGNELYTFGGNTRFESVRNGLKMCSGDYVIIHDAARPFISKDIIDSILAIKNNNNAILTYVDVKDTIKIIENGIIKTLPRQSLVAATTPQCAPLNILKEAYELAFNDNFIGTDDISLIEKYLPNVKIDLIKNNDESFKITTQLDLDLALKILEK